MTVRNIWSLQPGECITAEEIMKTTECEIFFPLRDVGVDLLVVKGQNHVGLQVKESRYYYGRTWPSGHEGHSWHQVRKVDFYIFLTYLPIIGKHKISSFENKFVVVPSSELEKRMTIKDPGKRETYSFCFHFEKESVWDERVTVELNNPLTNYSEYLDAWHSIKQTLEWRKINKKTM